MKIKKYMTAALLAAAAATLPSCMDLEPKAQMSDNIVWDTPENFQLFANQYYGWVQDWQRGFGGDFHSDFNSDLLCTTTVNIMSQGTNTIPNTDGGNFGDWYKRIYYCNLLLKNAEGFTGGNISVPVAESKFFRAWCHFELVQRYGNVILLTSPLDMDSPELYGPRTDRGAVIDQCIQDLWDAAAGLPDVPTATGRLCKSAAWGLLSRVALYEGTWQKFHNGGANATTTDERCKWLLTQAKNAADEVIKGNHYKLFYNDALGTESYRYMFILEDVKCNPAGVMKAGNTEYILARRHRDGDNLGTNITHAVTTSNNFYVTRKLANMFLCQDGLPVSISSQFKGYGTLTSEYDNRDNRMTNILRKNGQKYWDNEANHCRTAWDATDESRAMTYNSMQNSGYSNWKWAVERQVSDYMESFDYPMIRYAEVLLNYAEACYELDNRISNDDLNKSLNLVRKRVNPKMPNLTNELVSANASKGMNMREEIRRERTVELFLEGFRLDDLKRWATAPVEMSQDLEGVLVTGTEYETRWTGRTGALSKNGCVLMYTDRGAWQLEPKLYLLPVPVDQLQLNPAMGQTPGW